MLTNISYLQLSDISSSNSRVEDEGYFVSWKGRSKGVEGWLIVAEPDDGTESFQTRLNRYTKV